MGGPLDFGQGEWFEHLLSTRRFLWTEEERDRFAERFELEPGLQIADLGCGWGFLGHLLISKVEPGGRIEGFDLAESLITLGRERATQLGQARSLGFQVADILDGVEAKSGRFDRAMCQTFLMHLSRPEEALKEMKRLVRPGGLIAAIEPDLLQAAASSSDSHDRDDWEFQRKRLCLTTHYLDGVRRSGAGDYRVGNRLAELFVRTGITPIHHWMHPVLYQLHPPYQDETDEAQRQHRLELHSESGLRAEMDHIGDLARIGGASEDLLQTVQEGSLRRLQARRDSLKDGSYSFTATNAFFVCIGRVPEEGE